MKKEKLEISDKLLKNLSIDEIAELKVEVDDLLIKIDNILNTCNVALNS